MGTSATNVPATEGMKHHDLGGNVLEAPLQSHFSFALLSCFLATSCYQRDRVYKYIFFLKGEFFGFAEERQFLRVRRIKNKKNRHLERFFKKKLNEVGR